MLKRLPLLILLAIVLAGCEAPQATSSRSANNSAKPPQTQSARPIAYINGKTVTTLDLQPALIEAAGGTILSERVLDQLIREQLTAKSLELTPELIEHEKASMLETLSTDPDEAARLLNEMRSRRGLGEQRFSALLFRNAGLRLLVKDQVEIVPSLLRQAYQIRHGKRFRVRIIVAETFAQASELLNRARTGESFSDLAAMNSTDTSAAQGGLLSPISPADPTYPAVLRQALPPLEAGDISDLIAAEDRFIIMKVEEVLPPDDISYEAALPELARTVRLDLESQLMQQAARSMLAEAKVVVLDPTLNQSWQAQQQRTRSE